LAAARAPIAAPIAAPVDASAEAGAAPVPRWRPATGVSWRDREALKAQGAANGDSAPSPPPAASSSSERPKLNLARPSADRERERERAPERMPERAPERELPVRTSTPGDSEGPKSSRYIPPSMRHKQQEEGSPSTTPPPPPAVDGESTGKYRPGMFGSRRGGGAGMGQARRE